MKHAIALAILGLLIVPTQPEARSPRDLPPPTPAEVKANFLQLLDRPRARPDIDHHKIKPPYHNLTSERFDFASEIRPDGTKERVPVLMVRPEGVTGRLPVVIVLHGTGGKKEGMWNWLEQLAHRGFLAISIDARYHGERNGGYKDTSGYNDAVYQAFRSKPGEYQAHPFYYDTCWDVMRLIDYLVTRDDVDSARIGLTGTSKGGIEAYLTAAVDERIKVVVPAIAMQSFRWGLEHGQWQARANTIKAAHEQVAADLGQREVNPEVCQILWAKVVPGIRDEFDGPSMVRLLAGRPTLILNGELDANCPIDGAELAFSSARAAFHDAGADDRLKIHVAKGVGHTVTHEHHQAAIDWFVTWLEPTTPPSTARYLQFRKAHPEQARQFRPMRRPVGPRRPAPAVPTADPVSPACEPVR